MTDAPERLWIQSDHIPDEVALNKWTTEPDADEAHLFTEYARADLPTCDAGFAAGIEAAVDRLKKLSGKLDILACEDVLQIADELSALTPSTPPRDGVE